MEKQLKFSHVLSLQEMAVRSVGGALSNACDVSASITKFPMFLFHESSMQEYWQKNIEKKIEDKLLKLELPNVLKKQMAGLTGPINFEIKKWKQCNNRFYPRSGTGLPNSTRLCWTTAGTIDYRRTAMELVHCNEIDIHRRFEIACEYFLEDYIPLLWEQLSEEEKTVFCKISHSIHWQFLQLGWPHFLIDKPSSRYNPSVHNLTFNQYCFEKAAKKYQETTADFYFKKLTHKEQEVSLKRTFQYLFENASSRREESSTLCYLLSLMSPEQQMEVIRAHPLRVLMCFLHWSRLDLFVENMGLICPYLPHTEYFSLVFEMLEEYNTYTFSKFLQDFLEQSPLGLKEFFFDLNSDFPPARYYLSTFFSYDDSACVKSMFRSLKAAERVTFATHVHVFTFFLENMVGDRRHLVELCLREAGLLSKEGRERLEQACFEFGDVTLTYFGWTHYREKLQAFYDFLKEIDASEERKGQKRKLDA